MNIVSRCPDKLSTGRVRYVPFLENYPVLIPLFVINLSYYYGRINEKIQLYFGILILNIIILICVKLFSVNFEYHMI